MPSTIKQNHAKSCHAKIKQMSCHAKKTVQNELLLQAVHTCTPCSNSIFSAQNRVKRLFSPAIPARMVGENARPTKKNWPRKKRMASWARQRQQITEAADGGARARTGADGAVVLNRGAARGPMRCSRAADPGGPALLLPPGPAASQQGLRLQPAPHPRGAQRLHPAAQRAEELGKGFFRDKYYKYSSGAAGGTRAGLRAQGLAAGERAGRGHKAWRPASASARSTAPGC